MKNGLESTVFPDEEKIEDQNERYKTNLKNALLASIESNLSSASETNETDLYGDGLSETQAMRRDEMSRSRSDSTSIHNPEDTNVEEGFFNAYGSDSDSEDDFSEMSSLSDNSVGYEQEGGEEPYEESSNITHPSHRVVPGLSSSNSSYSSKFPPTNSSQPNLTGQHQNHHKSPKLSDNDDSSVSSNVFSSRVPSSNVSYSSKSPPTNSSQPNLTGQHPNHHKSPGHSDNDDSSIFSLNVPSLKSSKPHQTNSSKPNQTVQRQNHQNSLEDSDENTLSTPYSSAINRSIIVNSSTNPPSQEDITQTFAKLAQQYNYKRRPLNEINNDLLHKLNIVERMSPTNRNVLLANESFQESLKSIRSKLSDNSSDSTIQNCINKIETFTQQENISSSRSVDSTPYRTSLKTSQTLGQLSQFNSLPPSTSSTQYESINLYALTVEPDNKNVINSLKVINKLNAIQVLIKPRWAYKVYAPSSNEEYQFTLKQKSNGKSFPHTHFDINSISPTDNKEIKQIKLALTIMNMMENIVSQSPTLKIKTNDPLAAAIAHVYYYNYLEPSELKRNFMLKDTKYTEKELKTAQTILNGLIKPEQYKANVTSCPWYQQAMQIKLSVSLKMRPNF